MNTKTPNLHSVQADFLANIRQLNTRASYSNSMAALIRFLDETQETEVPYPISSLDNDVLVNFNQWLSVKYSPHTVQTYLAALQRFLTWLDSRDLLPDTFQLGKAQSRLKTTLGERGNMPYKHRRPDPELPAIVTYYDELPLPDASTKNNQKIRLDVLRSRAIVHTLYASAGRVSEVANLTREQVLDGRHDEVHLTGKGGKTRVILLTTQAMQAIRAYVTERNDLYPALFIGHGNRSKGKSLSRQAMWKVVKKAAQALDLHESTSPHAFRHYRATQLLNEGMPLESVQVFLGHTDIGTTRKVYAHTQTAVLRDQLATYDLSPEEALDALKRRRGDT